MDQIFTLQALVQKYLSKKGGRFYIFYVDMSKAFDRISHSCLFYRLITEGIHGIFLYVLTNMYEKLKSSVQVECGFTSYFDCKTGTRQGCMLSPFIFSIYLNELINSLNKTRIYLSETYPCVNILLYADDIDICADTVGNLQSQIECLDVFCKNWDMKVNLSKSKVMVFRNGGIVRLNEKCFFQGKQIETVSYYKYLGLLISTRMNWSMAIRTLSEQARKAMFKIINIEKQCNGLPPKTSLLLFDKLIKAVLLYESDIWGFQSNYYIEKIQLNYCKLLLGVKSSANTSAVLGECGRLPLSIDFKCKCVKYWLKLITFII